MMVSRPPVCSPVGGSQKETSMRRTSLGPVTALSSLILRRENLLGEAEACIVGGRVRCFIAPNET